MIATMGAAFVALDTNIDIRKSQPRPTIHAQNLPGYAMRHGREEQSSRRQARRIR
jgi:hypothetical protein